MNNETMDQKIYKQLLEMDKKENGEMKPTQYGAAFVIHVVFKAIPLGLWILKGAITALLGKTIIIQLILIAIVLDFWFTKNITGRRMTGLRWAFEEDPYGIERLRFEGRVNDQYVNSLSSKLFWFILGLYCLLPILFIVFSVLIAPNFHRIQLDDILLNVAMLLGGGINFYFFWQAKKGVSDRRHQLNTKLGGEFTKKLGTASVISFL